MILYKTPNGLRGYDRDELKVWMEKRHEWTKFSKWFRGQTGIIIDGKHIIYEDDVKRFYTGRPVLD